MDSTSKPQEKPYNPYGFKPPRDRTQTPAEILPRLIKNMGVGARLWQEDLKREWPDITGPQVAANTRPGRMQGRTLCVFVSNSMWLHELSKFGKNHLLEKLQSSFGKQRIRDLRFLIDPDGNS